MRPGLSPPRVLCCSGHDPTGGAGLQADIEATAAQGVHAINVITALTVQDTRNVQRVVPVDTALLTEQLTLLLDDGPVSAVKIGLIGSIEQLPLLADTLRRCEAPVVLDPVLRAGGGGTLAGDAIGAGLLEQLGPLTTVITPNAAEARRLVPQATDTQAQGAALLAHGCAHVLITGGDEPTDSADNHWFSADGRQRTFHWPRLPRGFHGAGCTLASALAARLALGEDIETALHRAQAYVHDALSQAWSVGRGRAIPNRL